MSSGVFSNLQRAFALALFPSQFVAWIDALSSQLGDFVTLTNFPVNAVLGTALATVDIVGLAIVPQTTAGVSVTLPAPTVTTPGRRFTVANTGSQALTVQGLSIVGGTAALFLWQGNAWISVA
jgi:hypothetical protein